MEPEGGASQAPFSLAPQAASIQGGDISLSDGYHPGSILTFVCPAGTYPYPIPSRVCQPDGRWTPMPRATRFRLPLYIRCPGQMSFENGFFIPRRTFHPIGDILSFQCSDGYQLLGSSQRYCQPNGQWNGTSPSGTASPWLCPRAIATGKGNRLGDRISFQCQTNLDLIGSSQRVCMLDGEWSDTQPSCRGMHFKDTLFFQRVRLHDPQGHLLSFNSFLYVYFLLDASHSVTEPNFSIFKDAVSQIIIRVSFSHFADHGNATGTNIHAALNAVYQMMINEERIMKDEWNKVRHAIILLTDGKSNLGGSPKIAVSHIEELVNVRNNRKDYLDIYVFGIGNLDVELSAMNEIASKKPGERHVFVMKNPQELKNAFEDLLDPRVLEDICGLANYSDSARWDQKNPWHVDSTCRGALISNTWVLTAAHCFNHLKNNWIVVLGKILHFFKKSIRIDHELYNIRAKTAQGIQEFYDYDISLIELEKPVTFGGRIRYCVFLPRPICLPCTEGASRALKKKPGTTCRDHGKHTRLLHTFNVSTPVIDLLNCGFLQHPMCVSGAIQKGMIYANVSNIDDVVTDRFLCSGEDKSLEVGVISWGTYDPCAKKNKNNNGEIIRDRPSKEYKPRDFYISLFQVQDWLRKHLNNSLKFIPMQ
uniref:Complement C2 n=1 Tax=Naja naja TaxID=35670 RepID=A0A8C6VAC7_NAJNA